MEEWFFVKKMNEIFVLLKKAGGRGKAEERKIKNEGKGGREREGKKGRERKGGREREEGVLKTRRLKEKAIEKKMQRKM